MYVKIEMESRLHLTFHRKANKPMTNTEIFVTHSHPDVVCTIRYSFGEEKKWHPKSNVTVVSLATINNACVASKTLQMITENCNWQWEMASVGKPLKNCCARILFCLMFGWCTKKKERRVNAKATLIQRARALHLHKRMFVCLSFDFCDACHVAIISPFGFWLFVFDPFSI